MTQHGQTLGLERKNLAVSKSVRREEKDGLEKKCETLGFLDYKFLLTTSDWTQPRYVILASYIRDYTDEDNIYKLAKIDTKIWNVTLIDTDRLAPIYIRERQTNFCRVLWVLKVSGGDPSTQTHQHRVPNQLPILN